MNKITILAAVTSLSMMATPLYAVDEHHTDKAQQAAPMPKAETMEKTTSPEVAPEHHMGEAQESMRNLQDLMGKIRQTKNPKERQKLMQEHMQTMQEGMKHMRALGGSMMGMESSGGKQGGMMMGMGGGGKQGGGMMTGDMMKTHNMMEMRMEMMESMMEQMIQREEMRDAMQAK
ncbi:MAG: hypothetical protein HY016_13035 [Nitrosomonadales bacterium]|jgi:hypothetical protein|nr:hypothetical protein [Nitrosomonadales bacterium]MBI3481256.1 hypothetical protein [Nitrosomonadales bacterium]